MSALLGALVVVLVALRVVVRRATEAWARDHWEQHTRDILEVEQVAAEVVAEDEAKAAADERDKEEGKSLSPKEQLLAEPVSPGPPDEDPVERRKRERRERAARIRERIRKRRIGEQLMDGGPVEVPATYAGRPKSLENPTKTSLNPSIPPRMSRGASAWGAAASSSRPKPAAPAAPQAPDAPPPTTAPDAPAAPSRGIAIPGTLPVETTTPPEAPEAAGLPVAPPTPDASDAPSSPAPAADAPNAAPSTMPSPGPIPPKPTRTISPVEPLVTEVGGASSNLQAPQAPKKKKKRKPKKRTYNPPPDPATLSDELIAKIKDLDAQGRTILANKAYREATGTSFRDAEKEVQRILAEP